MLLTLTFRLCTVAAVLLGQPTPASQHAPATGPGKPATTVPAGRPVLAAPAARPALALSTPEAPAATAPQMVTLTGVVLRRDGSPCPGAAVYLAGQAQQLVVTDARGAFALKAPAAGPLVLRADYLSQGSSRLVVEQPSGQPLRLTLDQ